MFMVWIGLRSVTREQELKEKTGRGLVPSDIRYHGSQLWTLLTFAFFGGFVSGAFGLGGGSVMQPMLISMGVPPAVSSATGMYMIMFSSAATSVMYATYNALDIPYALWLGTWSIIGFLFGVRIIERKVRESGRQSIIVYILAFILGISAILVPIFNGIEVYQDMQQGKDIWKMHDFCE